MKKFDCLSDKYLAFNHHFIEASAGTGKTFAIEHMYVRLLLEEPNVLEVEQIVVVTFTKAATKDLKRRIRKNIEKVLAIASNISMGTDENLNHYEYLRSSLKNIGVCIKRLEQALSCFHLAQIFTIHGFCYRMLKEFSIESKVFLSSEDMEVSAGSTFLKKCALDFLQFFISTNDFHPGQIEKVIKKYRSTSGFTKKLIGSLQYNFDDHYHENFESLSKFFSLKLSATTKQHVLCFQRFLEEFDLYYPQFLKTNIKASYEDLFEEVSLWKKLLEEKKCEDKTFEKVMQYNGQIFLFFDEKNRKKIIQQQPKIFLSEEFIQVKKELFSLVQKMLDPKQIIACLAKQFKDYVINILEEQEIITYDSLLKKMKKALLDKSFYQKVKSKYKAAIIDEFQDTDIDQWEIFQKLFNDDSHCLILVGDPKQSIYRFRKADIYTYLIAAKKIGKISYLSKNYRSTERLICALNSLFLTNNENDSWLYLPKTKESISYLPIESGVKEKDNFNDGKESIHFILAEGEVAKRWPTTYIEKELFITYIVKEVQKLHNKIPYNEIAILVKDRYQLQKVILKLQDHNIPYVSKSISSLTETTAFRSINQVIEAILFPKDKNFIKIVLAGPYCGMSIERIKEIQEDEMTYILSCFFHLKKVFEDKGVSYFFYELLNTSLTQGGLSVEERLIQEDNLSIYKDTLQLIEIILDYDEFHILSLEGILNLFQDLVELDPEVDERIKKVAQFDEVGVNVMTIHMSKGLEFDVVFAIGLAMRTHKQEKELFYEDNYFEEMDSEKHRQFYVAMTRARKRVYVPLAIDQSNRVVDFGTAAPIELFYSYKMREENQNVYENINKLTSKDFQNFVEKTLSCSSVELLEKAIDLKQLDEQTSCEIISPELVTLTKERKRVVSFSLFSQKHERRSVEENEEYIFSSKHLLPGPKTGVLLHKIFEVLFSNKMNRFYREEVYSEVVCKTLKNTFLEPQYERICEMIKRALQIPLYNDFSLKDLKLKDSEVELEFLFPLNNNQFMNGIIDLAFFHDDKYFLLDWKTNWLGDSIDNYDKLSLEKAMEENNYYLQKDIYSEAFDRFLKMKGINKKFGGMFYIFLRGIPAIADEKKSGILHLYSYENDRKRIEDKIENLWAE